MSTMVATQPEATPKTEVTPEELLAMPDGGHYELIDGELKERRVSVLSNLVALEIGGVLRNHCRQHNSGWIFAAELGYRCFPGNQSKVRRADVTFIRRDRYSLAAAHARRVHDDTSRSRSRGRFSQRLCRESRRKGRGISQGGSQARLGRLPGDPHGAGLSRGRNDEPVSRRRRAIQAKTSSRLPLQVDDFFPKPTEAEAQRTDNGVPIRRLRSVSSIAAPFARSQLGQFR